MGIKRGTGLQIGFEETFNTDQTTPKTYSVPFNDISLTFSQTLNTSATIANGRDAQEPFMGNKDATGSATIPLDTRNFGLWLKAVIGEPTSTVITREVVGTISDGSGAAGTQLVLADPSVILGVGDAITGVTTPTAVTAVTNTALGQYVVADSQLVTNDTMTITPAVPLYQHVFQVGCGVPSMIVQKAFGECVGNVMTGSEFERYNGVKANNISFEVGGDGELTASVDLVGCKITESDTSYDPAPIAYESLKLQNFKATLKVDGVVYPSSQTVSVQFGNNLETDLYFIGGEGARGALPEGTVTLSGSISCVYDDAQKTLQTAAKTQTPVSIEIIFATSQGQYLSLLMPNALIQLTGKPIEANGQVSVQPEFTAYRGGAASSMIATLVNDLTGGAYA
ncbi:MAG: hypothetical protein LBT81_02300 [Helicobacteraceae bacterium]|jgi:hypothetical protein|nr:hypothetical protein [Helicobacteraceae bacterium]